MKISSKTLLIISPAFIFLTASFIWYLISYQAISFFSGLLFLTFLIFLTFWQNFLSFRRSGELYGLKSKKQIIAVSLILALGFSELIWSISFLPFSFFILGGIIAVIFGIVTDIYKEYFKSLPNGLAVGNGKKFDKILLRDIVTGIVLIIIFILISPWFPPKTY